MIFAHFANYPKMLEEAKIARKLLVNELKGLPIETLLTPFPHTGIPYSLIYIVKESIDHDQHHTRQIAQLIEVHVAN